MEGYVRVVISLSDKRIIQGDFNVSGEPRLKDAINDGSEFVVLKKTTDQSGKALDYLLINKSHIISMEEFKE